MIATGADLLHGRFARRVVILLVGSALLPMTVLALVAFDHVQDVLSDLTLRHMLRESKALGLAVTERLHVASDELRLQLAHERYGIARPRQRRPDPLAQIQRAPRDLLSAQHHLSSAQREAVARGETTIVIRDGEGSGALVYLVQQDPAGGLAAALLDASYLWDLPVDRSKVLCILGARSQPLSCPVAHFASVRPLLEDRPNQQSAGSLHWTIGPTRYVGHYRALSLEREFTSPSWTLVLAADESDVLQPLTVFRSVFPLVLVTTVLAVTLLTISQIRRSLLPLRQLVQGTRRIAEGDFDTRVEVQSNDEFAELAESFNRMAHQLGRQIGTVQAMAAIDRMILSSTDSEHIMNVLLTQVPDLFECDAVAILTLDEPNGPRGVIRMEHRGRPRLDGAVAVSAEERARLDDTDRPLATSRSAHPDSFVASLPADAPEHWMLLPVRAAGTLNAIIAMGFDHGISVEEDDIERAHQLCDRAAVALSNAAYEEQLYRQTHYDSLTKLPNRVLLKDRLEQATARSRNNDLTVALLLLDLDRFKGVNDSLGHGAGDRLLREIAERLLRCVRPDDTVVRFGGDEFLIIVPDLPNDASVLSRASRVAETVLAALDEPVELERRRFSVGASIGIAIFPKDADDADDLLRKVDTAMYHAKSMGRGTYQFFSTELNEASSIRNELGEELRDAIAKDELLLQFQPRVDCKTGALRGAECLLRWHHPRHGLITPDVLIPIAEDIGIIEDIGRWIVRTACAQTRIWFDRGLPPVTVAINLSAREFRSRRLVEIFQGALTDSGMPADAIEVEVTERMLMTEAARTLGTLQDLAALGLRIVIDDFGSGYSSLSNLAQFPVHAVKIGRSFVRDITEHEAAAAVVAAAVGLAERLQLTVIATGIESVDQLDLVTRLGCHEAQGHFVGAPMPAAEFVRLLEHEPAAHAGATRRCSVHTLATRNMSTP